MPKILYMYIRLVNIGVYCMFPMGFYDGYGLGFGMTSSIPSPAPLSHQADTNTYVSHHEESGFDATTAFLAFSALSVLGGLLLARKMNNKDRLIRLAKDQAQAAAEAGRDAALKAAETAKAEAAHILHGANEDAAIRIEAGQRIAMEHINDGKALVDKQTQEFSAEMTAQQAHINTQQAAIDKQIAELRAHSDKLGLRYAEVADREAEVTRLAEELAKREEGLAKAGTSGVTKPLHTDTKPGFPPVKTEAELKVEAEAAGSAVKAGEIASSGKFFGAAIKDLHQKKYEQVIAKLQEAIRRNPNNAAALNELGFCLDKGLGVAQNREEAYKLFNQAIALEPENPHINVNLADCLRDGVGGAGPDFDKAIEHYLKVTPDGYVHANLGYCYEHKANIVGKDVITPEAEALYKNAVKHYEAAGDDAYSLYQLGVIKTKGLDGTPADIVEGIRLHKKAFELYLPLAKTDDAARNRLIELSRSLRTHITDQKCFMLNGGKGNKEIQKLLLEDVYFRAAMEQSQELTGHMPITWEVKPSSTGKQPDAPGSKGIDTDAPTEQFAPDTLHAPPTFVNPQRPDMGSVAGGMQPPVDVPLDRVRIGSDTVNDANPLGKQFGEGAGIGKETVVPTGDATSAEKAADGALTPNAAGDAVAPKEGEAAASQSADEAKTAVRGPSDDELKGTMQETKPPLGESPANTTVQTAADASGRTTSVMNEEDMKKLAAKSTTAPDPQDSDMFKNSSTLVTGGKDAAMFAEKSLRNVGIEAMGAGRFNEAVSSFEEAIDKGDIDAIPHLIDCFDKITDSEAFLKAGTEAQTEILSEMIDFLIVSARQGETPEIRTAMRGALGKMVDEMQTPEGSRFFQFLERIQNALK